MRLLVLTTSYPRGPEDPSGAFVHEMTEALSRDGFVCTTAALDAPSGGALTAIRAGRWRWLPAAMARWARLIRAVPCDAVLAHWLVPSAVLAQLTRRPVIGVAHGSDAAVLRAAPTLRRALVGRLSGLIAVSGPMAQELTVSSPRLPSLVSPMGLPDEEFRSAAILTGPSTRLLFLGRLVRSKGAAELIAAVRGLPSVTLTVAGDGPERRRLERGAPSNVRFSGHVSPAEREALFRAHHALCVPSVGHEGMPRVIIEAYAAGLPVLASDVGGVRDLVPASALICPGDRAAWRTSLQCVQRGWAPPRADVSHLRWSRLGPRMAAFIRHCAD